MQRLYIGISNPSCRMYRMAPTQHGSQRLRSLQRRLFPFGWGNVTKLALVYFFSTLYFYVPVGTLYLQSRGLNYVQINGLWGIIVGTMFLTEVPTGILADRIGRKRALVMALGLQLLGEVLYLFADTYPLFALTSVVAGLGFAFSSGCVEALVYDELKATGREVEMSKAMGTIGAAEKTANLLAFAVGGLLINELTQAQFILGIAATACAVSIGWLVTFTLREPPIEHAHEAAHEAAHGAAHKAAHETRPSSLALLRDGADLLRNNRAFRHLVVLALVAIPFKDYVGMYQTRFVEVGVTPLWLGLARALAAGLGIVGAQYAYRLEARLGTRRSLLLVTALPGALYLIAAVVIHPVASILAYCALSGSMSLKGPLFSGHLNRHIDSRNRATVLSLISMISGLYVALMGVVIGTIGDVSLTYAFIFMGLVVLAGAFVFRT